MVPSSGLGGQCGTQRAACLVSSEQDQKVCVPIKHVGRDPQSSPPPETQDKDSVTEEV